MQKDLTEVKIYQKVLGGEGYFFSETPCTLCFWDRDNEAVYSAWNDLQKSLKVIGDGTIQ